MVRRGSFLALVAITAILLVTRQAAMVGPGPAAGMSGQDEGHRGPAVGVPGMPAEARYPGILPKAQPPESAPAARQASRVPASARDVAVPAGTPASPGAQSAAVPTSGPPSSLQDFERRRAEARRFLANLHRDFLGSEGNADAIALWADLIASGTLTREQAVEHFLDSAANLRNAAPLARLYFAAFQRVPDEAGWSHWRSLAASGQSLEAISDAFAASGEFVSIYGGLDDAGFIDLAYRNTMGRSPAPSELAQWQSQLSSGLASRGRLLLALSDSPEYREAVANEVNASLLYSGLLRRTADVPGFSAWMRTVDREGLTRSAMISRFLDSPEYRERTGAKVGAES